MDVVARHRTLSRQIYLGGAFRPSAGPTIPVLNPATEEVIGEIAETTPAEIEEAIGLARVAQRAWWARSGAERADIMHEVTRATREMNAVLAESLTREQGKTYKEAMDEIGWCASAMSYYAEISRQEGGRVHGPSAPGQLHLTLKEPLGVVAAIIPFNYPYLLLFWQVAAAVGAGNAVIIKPSDLTSLSTLLLMEAFAALPPGLVQCVTGRGEAGRGLVAHEDIAGVAFTGSVTTAQAVAAECARTFKPALIEASGNDPFIVMPSAPVEITARGCAFAAFLNAGQVCTSAERIYVHEAVHDRFVSELVTAAQTLRIGNGLGKVDMGPMVSERERDRYERILARAIQQGATVACGGGRPRGLNRGWFTDATVLTGVTPEMDIVNDESFGPVAPIVRVRSLDEAIELANRSRFGLGANIYTADLAEAMRAVNEIQSGMVWVNVPLLDNDAVPFGGRKLSGTGRELGIEGLDQFRHTKMVLIDPEVREQQGWFPYPDGEAWPGGS
ncbi:MAG: aldehyde dehydrogenase [Hyphomicrobium sp.]|nr:aldehyde dehydrogenase [Hyphomicrobium sp.]PPD06990.1 MAG: aldehyde dehydrogenase [Hyphomicrobium sp.]